jgi:hypothetical protein
MRSTLRRTLYIKTRKDTQIKFYKAMAVHAFAGEFEIQTIKKERKQKLKM